jgi:hypothetical protein
MGPSQVVLKLLLDELGVAPQLGTFSDRLALQKTIYLTQLSGLDLSYRFGWYIHGPYCRDLTSEAFQLVEAMDAGEPVPTDPPLNPLAKELAAKAKTIWSDKPDQMCQSDWLELLASLHYLKHIVYWPGGRPRDFDDVFRSLVESKPKFRGRRDDALLAWERLEQVGLLRNKVMPRS